MSLTDQIRIAVRKSEGLSLDGLAEALPEGTDRNTISTIASQRVRAGEFLTRFEEGKKVFKPNPDFVPGQRKEATSVVPPPGRKSAKAKRDTNRKQTHAERKRDFFVAAESAEKTLKALKFNADTAADALKVYIHSVVNPVVYTALSNAHVSAQAALEAFIAQGSA